MTHGWKGRGLTLALAGWVFCAPMSPGHAAETSGITDAGAFLRQAENLASQDHTLFVQRLEQIHRSSPPLTTTQRWHLRYLDAFEATLAGKYSEANSQFQDVIDHSGDPTLVAKSSALLMNNLALTHRYRDAFVLAHRLTIELPQIQDKMARLQVLAYLSQMLNLAGQTDLAVKYAQMMQETIPPGMSTCYPRSMLIAARWNSKDLNSSSPDLKQAIDVCEAAHKPILANTIRLTLSGRYLKEEQPVPGTSGMAQARVALLLAHAQAESADAAVRRDRPRGAGRLHGGR